MIQSEFDTNVILVGEGDALPDPPFASRTGFVLVSSFEKKLPAASLFALKVEDTYVHPRPKRWKSAATNRAQTLDLRPSDIKFIQRLSDGARITESFTVFLPASIVEEGATEETRIQIRGDGGETMVLPISRRLMSEILEAQKAASNKTW